MRVREQDNVIKENKLLEVLKTERYYDWDSHIYKYRSPLY